MTSEREWSFTLMLEGPDDVMSDTIADAIFEACNSDVDIGVTNGTATAEVTRSAPTFQEAVLAVITDIEGAEAGLTVTEIEPDDFVGLDQIADRTSRSYESARLLAAGDRGPGGFPAPTAQVGRTGLWLWSEVLAWFETSGLAVQGRYRVNAASAKTINAALALRKQLRNASDESSRAAMISLATAS